MTQQDVLKRIIATKGWLAVREILFDNAVTLKPMNCDGMVTMDADTVYWVYSTSPAEHESFNKYLLCTSSNALSYFKHLKVKGIDHIQGFDVVIHTTPEELVKDVDNFTIHDFLVSQTYTSYLHGDGKPVLKKEGDVLLANEMNIRGATLEYTLSEAIALNDGKAMPKAYYDMFNANRLKFRTHMATLLGVTIDTLL